MSWKPRTTGPLRVFLFRHGQSHANTQSSLISGRQIESPLTDLGERQAQALGRYLARKGLPQFDLCYSSTAVRTKGTAQNALSQLPYDSMKDLIETDRLLEIDMGEWVGRPRETIYTDEVLAQINADPWNFHPPKGESQKQVEERMCQFFEDEIIPRVEEIRKEKGADCEVSVGLFIHCMTITCFLRSILNSDPAMTWKIKMENTSMTELFFEPKNHWFIEKLNATSHFDLLE